MSAKSMKQDRFTPIVKRALADTITNLGQLSVGERRELNRAVADGILSKGKGGPYPILKTVYARPEFNFAAARFTAIEELAKAHLLDISRGTDKFFPRVPFQQIAYAGKEKR